MLSDLIKSARTCRRFVQKESVALHTLQKLVDLARLSASSANLQPLRYLLSNDPNVNSKIFSTVAWAGYLRDWPGPAEGERPPAYIVILSDSKIVKKVNCDHGIAAQSIILGAREQGLSCCVISAIQQQELRKELQIPEQYQIQLVIAIGRCAEKRRLDALKEDGDIRYWRDSDEVHHVPKRALNDVIVAKFGK